MGALGEDAVTRPAELDALGSALAGRYQIVREIGRGGMATVYLAHELKHERRVALKVLHPELAVTIGPSRFLQEIRVTSRLQHPHILPVFDSGETGTREAGGGRLWYTMPFVEGESLRQRLVREKQLSVEAALRITRDVAGALEHAHRHGIVHRDIKPENILLEGEHAVVADFGIAQAIDAAGGERLTETGLALGTPTYMSPEQAAGQRGMDGRSDIYSLACVLYEMLAGSPPFAGPTPQVILARHSIDPVPSLRTARRTVPEGMEQAIMKALAKVPADRYASAVEFAAAAGDPTAAAASGGAPARSRGARLAIAGGVALGTALLLTVGFNLWGLRHRRPSPAAPAHIQSLAVLPLENLSNDSTQLGDGMTEALITDLGRISALRVISRTSVMRYKGTTKSAPEIARVLGVDAVLEGGIQRAGDSLRVDLRLISAATGYQLWAQRFDEGMEKRFAVEDAISRSLVSALKLSVTSAEERQLRTPPTTNGEAYDDFLRGKIHARTETPGEDSIAIGLFQHAVALDPGFAAAYAELAHAYGLRILWFAPRDTDALEEGLVAAEKALRLDPDLAEAHYARGWLLSTPASHWAYEQAIQELRRAIELNPNLADAHDWLGVVYWHIGVLDKALGEFRKVLALDPGNRLAEHRMAVVLVYQGKYEEGLRILRMVPREFNPSIVTYHFAWTLFLTGRSEEASTVIEDYLRRHPEDRGGVITGARALLRAKAGDRRGAEEDMRRAEQLGQGFGHFHHTAYSIAEAYALLRQPSLAVQWLRRATDDGLPCYPLLANDPNLDNLRQDPRFLALMVDLKAQWERWKAVL
jgi:serine/threonine protein kinase/tetratricopeptide (TPR) repeat protein